MALLRQTETRTKMLQDLETTTGLPAQERSVAKITGKITAQHKRQENGLESRRRTTRRTARSPLVR